MVLKDALAVKEKIVGQDILQICPNLFGVGGYIASIGKVSPNSQKGYGNTCPTC